MLFEAIIDRSMSAVKIRYNALGRRSPDKRFVRLMAFVCIGNQFVIERWPWRRGRPTLRCAQLCSDVVPFQGLLLCCLLAPQMFTLQGIVKKIEPYFTSESLITALTIDYSVPNRTEIANPQCCPPSELSVRRCHDFRMDIDWKMMGKQCQNRKEDEKEKDVEEHLKKGRTDELFSM